MPQPTTMFAIAAAVLAACATEPSSTAPDAGARAQPYAAKLAIGGGPVAALEDLMTAPVPLDETVIVPWRWGHPIAGAVFDGDRHYVVGQERLNVLTGDGTPVDREGIALAFPYDSVSENMAVAIAPGHLAAAYSATGGTLMLRIYRIVDGAIAPDPTDSVVQAPGHLGRMYPALAYGDGALWVVYNNPQGSPGQRHDVMSFRRFTVDGSAVDSAPVALSSVAPLSRAEVTFAGGRLVVAWKASDGVAVARVAGNGQVIDSSPIVFAGAVSELAVAGGEGGLLLVRDGAAQRLTHGLASVGSAIVYAPGARPVTHVAPTARGFRLVWFAAGTHVRDVPTGGEPGPEVVLPEVGYASAVSIGSDGRTVLIHAGTSSVAPAATVVAANGQLSATHVLRETQRGEGDPVLLASSGRYAASWTRYPGGAPQQRVAATLSATGELLTAPRPQAADERLVPRAGGFWRIGRSTVQALDPALAPAGEPIALGVSGSQLSPFADIALVVWYQDETLHGRRVDATGFLDPAPFPIAGGASAVTMVAGADEWLLAWCAGTTLRALRITTSGDIRDLPPRQLTVTENQSCWNLDAVHVGDGNYTVAWIGSGSRGTLWASRLSAAAGFSAPIGLQEADSQSSTSVRLVADGSSTLVFTSSYSFTGPGSLHRLDGNGELIGRSLPHSMYIPYSAFARIAPGRFLVISGGEWTAQGTTAHRLLRRELVFDTDGSGCTSGDSCRTGVCADGVCCDRGCGSDPADCAACSVAAGAAVDGTCGPRRAGIICRATTGICDVAEACDGAAVACPSDTAVDDDTACDDGDRCTSDDSCQQGACGGAAVECPAAGECQAARCDGDRGCVAVAVTDGVPCSAGRCQDGVCIEAADAGVADAGVADAGVADAGVADAGVTDAGSPAADARTSTPAPATPDDDSGCGCRTTGSSAPSWLAMATLLAVGLRRRRRDVRPPA